METEAAWQCTVGFLSGALHLPQSSCSLLLVDVHEVAHHTALDHIALSLHADLETTEREGKSSQSLPNGVVPGCVYLAAIGTQKAKTVGGRFGKHDVLKCSPPSPPLLLNSRNHSLGWAAVCRSALVS